MITRINQSEEIIERLRKEGKVKQIVWTPEQQKRWMDMMTELRRESRYKQAMSEIEASKIILTS